MAALPEAGRALSMDGTCTRRLPLVAQYPRLSGDYRVHVGRASRNLGSSERRKTAVCVVTYWCDARSLVFEGTPTSMIGFEESRLSKWLRHLNSTVGEERKIGVKEERTVVEASGVISTTYRISNVP